MTDVTAELHHDHGELLVVDDEPFLRDAAAVSLRFLGFGYGRSVVPGVSRPRLNASATAAARSPTPSLA
jgi:hypothetical protein